MHNARRPQPQSIEDERRGAGHSGAGCGSNCFSIGHMKAHILLRLLAASFTAVLLASCTASPGTVAGAAPRPKLVVFLVVDGLPQRQVLDYRDQLAPDGFARFLDRGAWFANAL